MFSNIFVLKATDKSETQSPDEKPTAKLEKGAVAPAVAVPSEPLFSKGTRAIIWGLQTRAVQGMLDFDYVCRRTEPSVAAMVYPMVGGDSKQNFYWGHNEILIPIYKSMADAMKNHPDVDVMVSALRFHAPLVFSQDYLCILLTSEDDQRHIFIELWDLTEFIFSHGVLGSRICGFYFKSAK